MDSFIENDSPYMLIPMRKKDFEKLSVAVKGKIFIKGNYPPANKSRTMRERDQQANAAAWEVLIASENNGLRLPKTQATVEGCAGYLHSI